MNRELISKAISNIDDAYIAESMYLPAVKADHAPERTLEMSNSEKTKRNVNSRRLLSLVLAACMIFALAISAYAVVKEFGLLDYLSQRGMKDGQAAETLLNTAPELYNNVSSDTTSYNEEDGAVYYSTKYAKDTILEALCDSQTIYLSAQVKPLENYFLIPQYLSSGDSVAELIGMEHFFEKDTKMTIGEYAASQGKTLAYAGISYYEEMEAQGDPLTGGAECRYDTDGTLYFYHTAQNIWNSREIIMKCTGKGYEPGAAMEEIERVSFEVKVKDKSAGAEDRVYTLFSPIVKTETGIQVNSLVIEETEIGLYATFNYSTEEAKFDGIFFKIVDANGKELTYLPGTNGTGEINNGDGTLSCTLNYQKADSIEELRFVIRDVYNSVNYGPYSFE